MQCVSPIFQPFLRNIRAVNGMMQNSHQMRFTFAASADKNNRSAISSLTKRTQGLEQISCGVGYFEEFLGGFIRCTLRITSMKRNRRTRHIRALKLFSEL